MQANVSAFALLAFASISPLALAQSTNFPGKLGAIVGKSSDGKSSGVTFRVWAPNAKSVSVIGSFNNWNGTRDPLKKEGDGGVWSADARQAQPGDEYLYLINDGLERKDPRGRQVGKDEKKSVVYNTSAFDWGTTAEYQSTATLKDLVIYQMHPGTFYDPHPADGEPATLLDAAAKLDHLKEMGINCVLLMPVNEFPGRHSWGYNPSDLFAIESAYGGPDALKAFVKAAHERGIAVHMDIVHNHYGPDSLDLWQFDGYGGGETQSGIYFYEDGERGSTPWGPRPDFGKPEVREFIADQVRMWFDEYKIDGLRWDSTVNIRAYNNGADVNPDGERMLHRIAKMIRQEYPGKVSVAEDSIGDPRFDSSWEYAFHHGEGGGVVPQLIRGSDAATEVDDIARRVDSELGFRRVIYTENHDETGRLNGKRRIVTDVDEKDPHGLVARRKAALAVVVTLTSPGVPLVFMGQDLLEDKEFHDSNPLDWQRGPDAFHAFQLMKDLVHLRRNLGNRSAALTGTHTRVVRADEGRKIIAYRRYLPGRPKDDIYVVINFSGEPVQNFPVTFPKAGEWNILLNTDDATYGRGFTSVATTNLRTDETQKIAVSLAPYSAQIFGLTKVEASVVDLAELQDAWDATHGSSQAVAAVGASAGEPEKDPAEEGPKFEEVALQSDSKELVVTANFTERPWDSSNQGMRMGLVEDHIWQCEMGFANGQNIQFKIVNVATGREYGSNGLDSGVMPISGTATEEGVPVSVAGPLEGDYILSFNDRTLRYRFEKKAASRCGRLNIMGDFNAYNRNSDPMHMVSDFTWQADIDLEPRQRLEFVFLADGSLEKQWGDDSTDHAAIPARGTAAEMAQTIKIEAEAEGPHRFTFNEETGEYSVVPLSPADVAPLPNVPAPEPVKEIRRVKKDTAATLDG
jgi:1,4-alpha-glucan branching enzyme